MPPNPNPAPNRPAARSSPAALGDQTPRHAERSLIGESARLAAEADVRARAARRPRRGGIRRPEAGRLAWARRCTSSRVEAGESARRPVHAIDQHRIARAVGQVASSQEGAPRGAHPSVRPAEVRPRMHVFRRRRANNTCSLFPAGSANRKCASRLTDSATNRLERGSRGHGRPLPGPEQRATRPRASTARGAPHR